jgi:hypothetical protein
MPEDLQRFSAVFAQWTGPEFRIVTIEFHIEDEQDGAGDCTGHSTDGRD